MEEGLFCLGLKVFLEEVPFEHLKDRNEEGQRRSILSRDRDGQRQGKGMCKEGTGHLVQPQHRKQMAVPLQVRLCHYSLFSSLGLSVLKMSSEIC